MVVEQFQRVAGGPAPSPPARRWPVAALVLLVVAFALRWPMFGDPIRGLDEQFYLLVGDRMWAGALPYIDIWDRKPVGLFLLFGAIRLLPGDGVVAAQVVATLFAAATAFTLAGIARRSVGWLAATLVGIVYLAALGELWGETTQTPVFYNLPLALAAMFVLRASDPPATRSGIRDAALAMLLAGLAIQIKTIAVFEAAFLGCWLVAAQWRAHRKAGPTLARAALFAAIGIAPTALAFASYAAMGHGGAWWHANILSVLAKGAALGPVAEDRLAGTLILLTPVLAVAAMGLWWRIKVRHADTAFLFGWSVAAGLGFVAIGGFWPHYTLPLVMPLLLLAAPLFAVRRRGVVLAGLMLVWPVLHTLVVAPNVAAKERRYAALALAGIPDDVATGCMLIYEGPVAYYQHKHACLVTPFAFPDHLRSSIEAPALGVDPAVALRSALAKRPLVILTVAQSQWTERNRINDAIIADALARDYRLTARLPHMADASGERLLVWQRR